MKTYEITLATEAIEVVEGTDFIVEEDTATGNIKAYKVKDGDKLKFYARADAFLYLNVLDGE